MFVPILRSQLLHLRSHFLLDVFLINFHLFRLLLHPFFIFRIITILSTISRISLAFLQLGQLILDFLFFFLRKDFSKTDSFIVDFFYFFIVGRILILFWTITIWCSRFGEFACPVGNAKAVTEESLGVLLLLLIILVFTVGVFFFIFCFFLVRPILIFKVSLCYLIE